ncbi:MAG: glycosyltransferase family 2 protein [Candidatus Omnitrophota bacterium]
MDYSVVIPLYNESENLDPLYKRVSSVLDSLGGDYEIIFIDDGSTDGSYDTLKDIAFLDKRVVVISFDKNYGQHPAVMAGFEQAKGEYVITLDSDLQNPPEEIPRLLKEMKPGIDMVAGYRKKRYDTFFRRCSSSMVNVFFSLLSGVWLKDYGSMLRIFNRETAMESARRYCKERLYIPLLVSKITKNIKEIETGHADRFRGESRYNFKKLLYMVWIIILRFHPNFYQALTRSHLVKKDDILYRIRARITNSVEAISG